MPNLHERTGLARFFTWSLCCALCVGSSPRMVSKSASGPVNKPLVPVTVQKASLPAGQPLPMSDQLWEYLRTGLNYLETSGNAYPPDYRHPGNVAFGALGLTESAVQDVQQRCKAMEGYTSKEVFSQQEVYETFARMYADILLRHYLKIDYTAMPPAEVFDCLQKAWFLGPNLYKQGRQVVFSREKKCQAFTASIGFPLSFQAQSMIAHLP